MAETEKISVMYTEEEVNDRIKELGAEISEELGGEPVKVVCVLKGASFFATELAKRITCPVFMDFICCSSYGSGTESSHEVKIVKDLDTDIAGENVLIAEDIIDSGYTLQYLTEEFKKRGAKRVLICVMLSKPDRREVEVPVDYIGYTVPDQFIVGYGLDYAQKYRNLPFIGTVEF
ncbi:MAG: hypoxanthine phosphoribosyltransferase [Lachnospiraceae bacterium]|nr:hypoxanthine phosphoribosyltransferase [Lachnospiraceae bacterium]